MFSETTPLPSACHPTASHPVSFCPAIQQLLDEHRLLRQKIRDLIEDAGTLFNSKKPKQHPDTLRALLALFMGEQTFKLQLDIHAEKEERGLFTALKEEVGTDFGPVHVMEFEHEEAKRQLARFEELASSPESDPKKAAIYLMDACQVLLLHFNKEENVLFPFAENTLTIERKQQLFCSFHA
ncbi:hemerythrin domain-containing protein [Aneurinibacillus sp. REN35]|uniref:hemerythrin domain-containing protein n=1 Tax=Aneurinibacillus sp. REN35 TaxID=3237286 RepID=UPI003528D3C8